MIWGIPKSTGGIVNRKPFPLLFYIIFTIAILVGCTLPTATTASDVQKTTTVTPTSLGLLTPEFTLTPNPCQGLSGEIEIEILVGPAEAVGLEPLSIGKIPFTIANQKPYTIQGKTHLSYNKTMNYDWGTYTVILEMDADLAGECVLAEAGNSLNLAVTLSGNQNVVVVYKLVPETFPWTGTATVNTSFPIQDNATAKGEGWIFVLHLK
jgi:hypothetical protein